VVDAAADNRRRRHAGRRIGGLGRALAPHRRLAADALEAFFGQRHSILASLALHVAQEFGVPLSEIHYDPTHIVLHGVYVVDEKHRKAAMGNAGWRNCNLRTTFKKIVKRAGLTAWPRLFHNLRSSRQTELAERFPSHVVCDWLGNSEDIARKHYCQTTDAHFADAAGGPTEGGAENGARTAHGRRKMRRSGHAPGLAVIRRRKRNPLQVRRFCDSTQYATRCRIGT
jgi:hypothetical protein